MKRVTTHVTPFQKRQIRSKEKTAWFRFADPQFELTNNRGMVCLCCHTLQNGYDDDNGFVQILVDNDDADRKLVTIYDSQQELLDHQKELHEEHRHPDDPNDIDISFPPQLRNKRRKEQGEFSDFLLPTKLKEYMTRVEGINTNPYMLLSDSQLHQEGLLYCSVCHATSDDEQDDDKD